MNIENITSRIETECQNYRFGLLPKIRSELHQQQSTGLPIFRPNTIDNAEGYAFHYGGRRELQFNLGFEDSGKYLRYGIAFSLEASQTLLDFTDLFPQIKAFNEFVIEKPEYFKDVKMWHWVGSNRSITHSVTIIPEEILIKGSFIFIGKLVSVNSIDINEILTLFDYLLDVYEYSVSEGKSLNINSSNSGLIFNSDQIKLPGKYNYSHSKDLVDVSVRHSLIQFALEKELKIEYGSKNVGLENYCNGNRVDIVCKSKNGYIFYEIKTGSTARSCIRQAIGQLMEYIHWPPSPNVEEVVVVGEPSLTPQESQYLKSLQSSISIPISYRSVSI